jgi:hypothetical protein
MVYAWSGCRGSLFWLLDKKAATWWGGGKGVFGGISFLSKHVQGAAIVWLTFPALRVVA